MANEYMAKAMQSEYYTPYHIEAVIAGVHTQTKDYASTNWALIARLYGKLAQVNKGPIILLNRAFALMKSGQLEEAEAIITDLDSKSFGIHQYLYFAVCSNLEDEKGDTKRKKSLLWQALDTAPNDATREILKHRLLKAETD